VTILGHAQRGGTPTAFAPVRGTQLGIALLNWRWRSVGDNGGAADGRASRRAISEAMSHLKTIPDSLHQVAEISFA
jgi:6-phosphofructokinase